MYCVSMVVCGVHVVWGHVVWVHVVWGHVVWGACSTHTQVWVAIYCINLIQKLTEVNGRTTSMQGRSIGRAPRVNRAVCYSHCIPTEFRYTLNNNKLEQLMTCGM